MKSNPWHGYLGNNFNWPQPDLSAYSDAQARPEYTNVKAHEYLDSEKVLREKITVLAKLLRGSNFTVAYTGAGLSSSSGLDDYATKSEKTLASRPHVAPEQGSGFLARPNRSHQALTQLHAANLLRCVVNQNHDGLLQKAGFPQSSLNEIHGSWFDPSNPGGNQLRDDLFQGLLELEQKTELCLALGTSISGLNADRLCQTPAKKYPKSGQGLVIINLQKTRLDEVSTLRIFANLDYALDLLCTELGLLPPPTPPNFLAFNSGFLDLPYHPTTGVLSKAQSCTLILSPGTPIRITTGNMAGCEGIIGPRNEEGHYHLQIFVPVEGMEDVKITHDHLLGVWWLQEAQNGTIPRIPFVMK